MHEMRGSLFLCFCSFFNGRLNFQIWHHKAKAPKSHPEGWCSLDCGRFRRGFNSFSFSITMPKKKKKPGGTQLAARSIGFHIFFLCKLNQKNSGGEEKTLLSLSLSFFFFYLKNMVQREGGQRLGNTASSKKISNNKQKQRRKKKIQTK